MIKRAWYLPGNRPRVPWGTHMNFPLKKNLFIYLFIIFGSSRSSLLHTEFLQLQQAGTPFHLWGTGFSLRWHLLLWTSGSRCTGLIVPWCVESSQTGVEPMSPAWAGRFPATGPPRKSEFPIFVKWPVAQDAASLLWAEVSFQRKLHLPPRERRGWQKKCG